MRWMARLSPLVWWLSQADPGFQDSFNGFVWEEAAAKGTSKKIVGNVSLNRAPGAPRRKIICNVVVQREYRRRGIARSLTEAAIREADESGAGAVVLQVYQDNATALKLYEDLGFRRVASETVAQLKAIGPVDLVGAPGYQLRPWQPHDGAAALDLARLVTPAPHQWMKPIRSGDYVLGWWDRAWQRLVDLMAGRRVYRLVAYQGDQLAAMMTLTASFRVEEYRGRRRHLHKLAMLVHPEHEGQVEAALIGRALHTLAAAPVGPVRAMVDSAHGATLRTMLDLGFARRRTLLTYIKELSPSQKGARGL
jgi:GNAT superfamily N-acetyltransferase